MPTLASDALPSIRHLFEPERPGPMIVGHIVHAGEGRVQVDRWPDPRVVCAELPGNLALRGDPSAVGADRIVDQLTGFVEAESDWLPVLRRSDPDVAVWDRVVASLPEEVAVRGSDRAVRLGVADAAAIEDLPDDLSWISSTWGGPAGMASAEVAHGVYLDGMLASIALPFFLGRQYEDIGVVTRSEYRQQGLSADCARAVVADIRARRHIPSWTTSPDNIGSLAVAERLGFEHDRDDVLYAVRTPIPE